MADFNSYRDEYQQTAMSRGGALTVTFINQVYGWMCGGLLLTALAAYAVVATPDLQKMVLGSRGMFLFLILLELGLVMAISWGINKMNSVAAATCFIAYSIINGLTLSVILFVYTQASVALVFLITAGTFGGMSMYGYLTKRDLTSWGNILMMGLIGIIIASLVNFFMQSNAMTWIISYLGVAIFMGLTAYDSQKIKNMSMALEGSADREGIRKMALLGALTLYLDFINLFLFLLRIFGNRR